MHLGWTKEWAYLAVRRRNYQLGWKACPWPWWNCQQSMSASNSNVLCRMLLPRQNKSSCVAIISSIATKLTPMCWPSWLPSIEPNVILRPPFNSFSLYIACYIFFRQPMLLGVWFSWRINKIAKSDSFRMKDTTRVESGSFDGRRMVNIRVVVWGRDPAHLWHSTNSLLRWHRST